MKSLFYQHLFELLFALVFAVAVGLILDLLNPDSASRRALRYLKNKWSETSEKRLLERIDYLQAYREELMRGRDVYLICFQTLFVILMLFGGVAGLEIARHSGQSYPRFVVGPLTFDELSLILLILMIIVALRGLSLSTIRPMRKRAEQLATIDKEISDLKTKAKKAD